MVFCVRCEFVLVNNLAKMRDVKEMCDRTSNIMTNHEEWDISET